MVEIIIALIGVAGGIISTLLAHHLSGRRKIAIAKPPLATVTNISGRWEVLVEGGDPAQPNAVMFLQQKGETIQAECRYRSKKSGEQDIRIFDYSGIYSAGQLAMTFRQRDSQDLIIGAVVLKLEDAASFSGKTVFWHHKKNLLDLDDFKMRRQT